MTDKTADYPELSVIHVTQPHKIVIMPASKNTKCCLSNCLDKNIALGEITMGASYSGGKGRVYIHHYHNLNYLFSQ